MNDKAQAGERPQLDRDRLEAFIKQIGTQVAAGFNCSLSHLGDGLGLYRALAEAGPMNSDELAAHTGLHERWLREWLRHQACVQQVEYEDGRFSLSPEAAAVLAEEGHPFFFASGFGAVAATYPSLPKMPEVFETGPRPHLRRPRRGLRLRRRTHVVLRPEARTGAEDPAAGGRHGGTPRSRCPGGGRGLRRRHGNRGDGGGVPELNVRRLRHLQARPHSRQRQLRTPAERPTCGWRTPTRNRWARASSTSSPPSTSSTTRLIQIA